MNIERRKLISGRNAFFVLQLLSVIRKYRLEHSLTDCSCGICEAADKLLKEAESQPKWKQKQ